MLHRLPRGGTVGGMTVERQGVRILVARNGGRTIGRRGVLGS